MCSKLEHSVLPLFRQVASQLGALARWDELCKDAWFQGFRGDYLSLLSIRLVLWGFLGAAVIPREVRWVIKCMTQAERIWSDQSYLLRSSSLLSALFGLTSAVAGDSSCSGLIEVDPGCSLVVGDDCYWADAGCSVSFSAVGDAIFFTLFA